ncbi:MAG: DNA mismatch repair protein MutS, partial [Pseudomonadota bacterium]
MMAQYLEIKSRYPDALLFYRMGDFYELFFADAEAASAALDIALTKRGKHEGSDIAMCGVPHHAAEGYLLTLIRKGFRVAVCEQLESPAEAKKRGYKAVVKRDVVRLVTPGTLTEDTLLNAREHNFLAAYAEIRGEAALAWVDVSTGDLQVAGLEPAHLGRFLARIAPSELLVREAEAEDVRPIAEDAGVTLTARAASSFDSTQGEARVKALFDVSALDGFGSFTRTDLSALGALIDYLDLTQRGKLPLIRPPLKEVAGGVMQIDMATRRNLELTRSLSGGRDGALLSTIDRTLTGAGARLLELRLSSPSTDPATISARHDALTYFHEAPEVAGAVRDHLRKTPDIERALSRLSLERGGPRDLAALRAGLGAAGALAERLEADELPALITAARRDLTGHGELADLLAAALVEEPPHLVRDGGFVSPGYDTDLDAARRLRDEGKGVIAGLQKTYQDATGIAALKIKHNNVLGYFVETPATHAEKMLAEPNSETFRHRQTTANQVRFTTGELSSLETRILNAGSEAIEREKAIFAALAARVLGRGAEIALAAKALAELDLATALADLAAG